eukprot:CAMPEP_0172916284 /NCGR_PEP_ID=MMETSP1075-20121228/196027_1 /TAXON_ID=2916 /ORGANISM="Ceratium fusus, Strain PA161109" /LENGTH=151 /DNA_ID=CAMNT_0013775555 /DNA_START=275 /DNA_END=727 /DNA_ORIENTATION=-
MAPSHTGEAARRFSSKKSVACNDVEAVDSPESRPVSLTEAVAKILHSSQTTPLHDKSNETATDDAAVVMRHGGRSRLASHKHTWQPTPSGDEHDGFPSVAGTRQSSLYSNRPKPSIAADPGGEDEPLLQCRAGKRNPSKDSSEIRSSSKRG